MRRNKSYKILSLLLLLGLKVHALSPPNAQHAQTKLQALDLQINTLQQALTTVNHEKNHHNNKLAITEKQIGEGVASLRSLQKTIQDKEQGILTLQDQLSGLNQQLNQQQQFLAEQIKVRYQMGEYQPLKWLLNQDDPTKARELFNYYEYFVKARTGAIAKISITKQDIESRKNTLNLQIAENRQLKNRLDVHQKSLEIKKRYHRQLINKLDTTIENHQQNLDNAQKHKQDLKQLLQRLAEQSLETNPIPFEQMRKKLPLPVQISIKNTKQLNQGMTFFAAEGTPVTAVHLGKIVFSDWLKGYGLLLIIDHGHGFMSLYAHNQSLFKHKGEVVAQNETIASLGHSGGLKQDALYFEIRLKGKAIPPLEWFA